MQEFVVYVKPEADRLHFHQRHEKLLDHNRENKGHMDWSSSKPSKKTRKALRAAMLPSVLLSHYSSRFQDARPSMLPTAKSLRVQEKYDVLFEAAEKTERDIYVSNVVGGYLDLVMPEESQQSTSMSWCRFLSMMMHYHEYNSMFFGRSLQTPRLLRYTSVVLGLLLVVFFDTLFYGVFYPDSDVCEGLLSAEACLAEDSRISSAKLCLWTVDDSYAGGGVCTLTQPPKELILICVVVLLTVTICVPINFLYDLLLYNVCFCWSAGEEEEYLGRTTQHVEKSPVQVIPYVLPISTTLHHTNTLSTTPSSIPHLQIKPLFYTQHP
jgi:hypothetical protein